jgi:uncharacterized protein YigE (DUF2233 family)
MQRNIFLIVPAVLLLAFIYQNKKINKKTGPPDFLTYIADPIKQDLRLYWRDKNSKNYYTFENLKTKLATEDKELIFAMNGGMYKKDGTPQGLFIEEGVTKAKADRKQKGYGNFYLQPNGIFYLTKDKKAVVCTSENFKISKDINYATQSGPMLVTEGKIHPKFGRESTSTHIRNGVGILQNGQILFAMSKEKVNLYNFAEYFKKQGCKNALYLDGYVSKAYLSSEGIHQRGGNFGVIIGEVIEKKD